VLLGLSLGPVSVACTGGGNGTQAADPVGVVQAALVEPDFKLEPSGAAIESAQIDGWFDLSAATDPDQFHPNHEHHVYCPTAAGSTKLLVFFAGTGNAPSNYDYFLRRAAVWGFHVIGLDYWNLESLGEVCSVERGGDLPPGTTYADCIEAEREQVWNSIVPPSAGLGINDRLPAFVAHQNQVDDTTKSSAKESFAGRDAVKWRLLELLRVLNQRATSGNCSHANWSQFVKDPSCFGRNADVAGCDLVWSQIAVAGHSAGSNMAGLIGSLHTPSRVLMFSGPEDGTDVSWVAKTPAEPSRYFGLIDIADTGGTGDRVTNVVKDWKQLEIPGSVDGAPPALITTISLSQHQALMNYVALGMSGSWGGPHNATVVDSIDGTTPPGNLLLAWYLMSLSPTSP
jgi:hypothetical protein